MPVNKRTVYTITRSEGCWLEISVSPYGVIIEGFWADGSGNGEVELADSSETLSDLVAALMDIQMAKNKENN